MRMKREVTEQRKEFPRREFIWRCLVIVHDSGNVGIGGTRTLFVENIKKPWSRIILNQIRALIFETQGRYEVLIEIGRWRAYEKLMVVVMYSKV